MRALGCCVASLLPSPWCRPHHVAHGCRHCNVVELRCTASSHLAPCTMQLCAKLDDNFCCLVRAQVLADAESVSTVVHAIRMRWPRAPRRIVYDDGCNAHAFALNRDPAYYGGSEWYVDEPHYSNHKNCCLAYNTGKPQAPVGVVGEWDGMLMHRCGLVGGYQCTCGLVIG